MPVINIIFQQSGDNNLTPGSRDDLALNLPVTVLNQNPAGIASYLWQFIDIPAGSVAVIDSPTNSVVHFTPDIVGTYLVKLAINNGSVINTAGAAVKTVNLHIRLPAAGEITEFGPKGWSRAIEAGLKILDDGYGIDSGSVQLSPGSRQTGFINVSGNLTVNSGLFSGNIAISEAIDTAGSNILKLGTGVNGSTSGILMGRSGIDVVIPSNIGMSEGKAIRLETIETTNWSIGKNLSLFTKSTLSSSSMDFVIANSANQGLAIGTDGGTSIFEIEAITKNTFFAGNVLLAAGKSIDAYGSGILNIATTTATGGQLGVNTGGFLQWGTTASSSIVDNGFLAAYGNNQFQLNSGGAKIISFGGGAVGLNVTFQDLNNNQPYGSFDGGRFGIGVNTNSPGLPAQSGAFAAGTPIFQVVCTDTGSPAASITAAAGQTAHTFNINRHGATNGDMFCIDNNGNVGVNTISPAVRFEVDGQTWIRGVGATLQVDDIATFGNNINGTGALTLQDSSGNFSQFNLTNTGTISYSNGPFTMLSKSPDGPSAQIAILNTSGISWSNPNARLLSVQNNSIEKFGVDVHGDGYFAGNIWVDGYVISPAGARAGQALVYNGSAFVPSIIAITVNLSDLLLTNIAPIVVADLPTHTAGNFRVSVFFRIVVSETNITIDLNYTDNGSVVQTLHILPMTLEPVGNYTIPAVLINCDTSDINLTVTAGTANQVYISCAIEELI